MSQYDLPDPKQRPVAILGGGVLGRRIGCVWAAAGYDVHIRDPNEKARVDAIQYIDDNIGSETYSSLSKGERKPGRYSAFADIEPAIKNAWFVIEAVPEILSLKINTFADVDQYAPKDCIMATNSSSYKSSLMLERVSEDGKRRILNAHYMMPPDILAVELMTDGHTHPEIFPFLSTLHRDIGLTPATARKESTGFIINRLWAAVKREILTIIAEDVSDPSQIDDLWCQMFSAEVAPCILMDRIGLDTVAFIEDNYVKERNLDTTLTVDFLRKNYIDKGRLGAKSGKGGLYPPDNHDSDLQSGDAKVEKSDTVDKHPTLYVLDVGLGSNVAQPEDSVRSGKVLSMTKDGKVLKELVTGLSLPDGIVVSGSANRMFFTLMGPSVSTNTGQVASAALDGTDFKIIIQQGKVHTPKQLTLHEKSKKLYFCDREGLRIHRCNFDGSDHEVVLQTGDWQRPEHKTDETRWCVGIAIDSQRDHIYWSQKGASKAGAGRIFRAGLQIPANETASTRSDIALIFDNLPEPIDLDFESATQTLYWTDRGEHPFGNSLNMASMGSQSNTRSILARHFNEAIGLRADHGNQQIYVADLGGSVYRIGVDDKRVVKVHGSDAAYTGIDIV